MIHNHFDLVLIALSIQYVPLVHLLHACGSTSQIDICLHQDVFIIQQIYEFFNQTVSPYAGGSSR